MAVAALAPICTSRLVHGLSGWFRTSTRAAGARTADTSPRRPTPTCEPSWSRPPGAINTAPYVGAEIAKRHKGLPPEAVPRAWGAPLRPCGRFRHLAEPKNTKSVVAEAALGELAGFLWAELVA